MKIYNWIDSLFDTKEKRKTWVLWSAALYVIWQLIWLDGFFFQLAKVQDYESLFTFMKSMGMYGNSVIIRVVFGLISGNRIDLTGLFVSMFQNVYLFDVLMILICILTLSTRKKGYMAGMLMCTYFIFLCSILIFGIQSKSVLMLISLLKLLAYVSVFLFAGLSIYVLYRIVKSIYTLYK